MIDLDSPVKPLHGQRSLFPDVPPVCRCRVCGRALRGDRSIAAGVGPNCRKREQPELWERDVVYLSDRHVRTVYRRKQA